MIYYASRTLNNTQMNYTTTGKITTCYNICIGQFWSYLISLSILIYFYHAIIRYLMPKQDTKSILLW